MPNWTLSTSSLCLFWDLSHTHTRAQTHRYTHVHTHAHLTPESFSAFKPLFLIAPHSHIHSHRHAGRDTQQRKKKGKSTLHLVVLRRSKCRQDKDRVYDGGRVGGPNREESKGRNTEKLLEENTTRGFLKNLDTRQFAPNTQLPLTPDASPISAFIILQHSTAVDSDEHGPLHVSLLLVIFTLWITLWYLLSAGVRTSADVSLKLMLRENW